MSNATIHVIQNGYGFVDEMDMYHASATCTLVLSDEINVIVDPGGVWEKEKIINQLKSHGLTESNVDVVVGTHGHSDHIGNINLFVSAKQIIGFDINIGDTYESNDLKNGVPYVLVKNKMIIYPTPGHTMQDVSLVVYNTEDYGTIGICGDLFENEDDELIWPEISESQSVQRENRKKMLDLCDFIVPGHGTMFKNLNKPKH